MEKQPLTQIPTGPDEIGAVAEAEGPLKLKRKKNASEMKQLHNLELLVRNEETSGFVGFYLNNQR